ncbi:sodium:solute symporter [Bacillus salipaludis]|uniref:Sodium:solute symporter n=1 Tax=Bacillus salipaludis TaxID=2547811 RepID=A0ABW8RIN6_9BACI
MIAFILLCVLFIVMGILLSKRVSNGTEFLVAGRGLPSIALAFTIAATHFGGGALIGGIENGAQFGVWAGTYVIISFGIACFVNAYIAPKFRRVANNLTPPDFIESRFGHSKFLRGYHVAVYIFGTIAIMAAQFSAFGGIATAFGINRNVAVILGAIVVVLYTVMAGMWGVAATDFVQLLICLIFLPIVAVVGMGIMTTETGVTVGNLLSTPFFEQNGSVGNFLYSLIPTIVGSAFAYEFYLRYQSSKDEKDARNSSIVAGILLLALAIPVGIIGAMGHKLYPNIPGTEVLSYVVSQTIPAWAGYLFLAAVLAAIMSTASAMMNSLSGMVARDIYHKLFNHEMEFDSLPYTLRLSKISTVIGGLAAMLVALKFTSVIGLLFWTSPLQSGVIFAPMIFGLFWKKSSKTGAYAAIIVGAVVALIDMLGIYALPERMLVTMAASSLALIIGSLVKPDVDQNHSLKTGGQGQSLT